MKILIVLFVLGVNHSFWGSSVFSAEICTEDLSVTYRHAVTASSEFNSNDKTTNYGSDRAFLNATETISTAGITQMGAWVAEKNNFNQWIQIELKNVSLIRGVISQGRNGCCQQWVTKYRVLYSEDCHKWHTVGDFNNTDAFFKGNSDENSKVTNMFYCPIMAKCIRINPLGWNKNIALRVGLVGCQLNLQGATSGTTTTSTHLNLTTTAQVTTPSQTPSTSKSTSTTATTTSTIRSTQQTAVSTVKHQNGACVKSCQGHANGDYQSCSGCDVYVTCVWAVMYDKRPCPKTLTWDDVKKRCLSTSSTCP